MSEASRLVASDADGPDRPNDTQPASRAAAVPALAVGVLAAVIAFLGSWHPSIWKDEADSISASTRSLGDLWRLVLHVDAVHGLYYVLLHEWIAAFGQSAVSIRLPSALAVGLAAAGVYALTAQWRTPAVAGLAGIVFAVLPRVTWAGVEARSFALTAAFAVWATVAVIVAVRRGGVGRWALYAVLIALGTAVNIYVAVLVLCHAVSLLVITGVRGRLSAWLAAAVVGLLLASPVVVQSARESSQLGITSQSWAGLLRNAFVNQWFLGGTPSPRSTTSPGLEFTTDPGSLWKPASVLLAALGWILIVIALVAAWRRPMGDPQRHAAAWTWPWLVLPTGLIGLYSIYVSPMYNPRYFTFCAPAVAILVACGIAAVLARFVRLVAVVLVVVLAAPVWYSQRLRYGKSATDWVDVAAYVRTHKSTGQGVYFVPRSVPTGNTVGASTRYVRNAYPSSFTGLTDVTLVRSGAADASLNGRSRTLAAASADLRRLSGVWVIRRTDYPSDATAADEQVLRRAGLTRTRHWQGPSDVVELWTRQPGSS